MNASLGAHSQRVDIGVIGLGYIGLPTAVVLADNFDVVAGYDIDDARRRFVENAVAPFVEPGLDQLLKKAVTSGKLVVTDSIATAENYVIAVPTPISEDRSADLTYIFSAIESLAETLRGDELLIIESTCPPGTTARLVDRIVELRPDLKEAVDSERMGIAYCPERVLPGNIIEELQSNDRIIGGYTTNASNRAAKLYSQFCRGQLWLTDSRTAEMSKLAENAFRDVNIAFANQLELLCVQNEVDVWELRELANKHPRVNILEPGPGVGGHCIAVDPWFLVGAEGNAPLIESARHLNDSKPQNISNRIVELVQSVDEPHILALGLAFKENVDDVRHSPAVEVVRIFSEARPDAEITVIDPLVSVCPPEIQGISNVHFLWEMPTDFAGVDVVVVLVAHNEFKDLTLSQFGEVKLVDTRGLFKGSM